MALTDRIRVGLAYLIGLFWGFFVALRCVRLIVTKRKTFFAKKNRSVPPSCLQDPDLGEHSYLQVTVGNPSVKLHYVESGPKDGQLMVMIHGFPEFWYSWRNQIKEFNTKYRVVAVDLRGYGNSSKPTGVEHYTVDKVADDIRCLIESLGGGKPCILVGHDWGGLITWGVTSRFPNLVEKTVLMNCPHMTVLNKSVWSSFKQFLKSWYFFLFMLPYFTEWLFSSEDLKMLDNAFMGAKAGAFTAQDIEAYKHTFNTRADMTGPVNYYRAMMTYGHPTTQPSGQIETPVLLLWGTLDAALGREMAEMSRDYARDFRIIYIEGASHWVQHDEPLAVNKHVWAFLE